MTTPPHGSPPHHAPAALTPRQATPPPASASAPGAQPRPTRLTGIDIARGVAILGMFTAHLGDDAPGGGADPSWLMLADGRSAALFAFLAGVSLALSTGRTRPPSGAAMTRARLRITYRAGMLFILGALLILLETPLYVILPAYAAMFLLALPFLGANRGRLVLGAATCAIVSPAVIFLLTTPLHAGGRSIVGGWTGWEDPVESELDILATGHYAALIYSAFILLGLAVGRSNLTSVRFQAGMIAAGTLLATVAWGSSRLLLDAGAAEGSPYLYHLVNGEPHEYSPVEIVGSCGTSLAVTGLLLILTRPGRPGRVVAAICSPVAAAGSMSLTLYTGHIVAIAILGNDVVWYPESNGVLIVFIVVALVFAWAWRHVLGQGPLERALAVLADTGR